MQSVQTHNSIFTPLRQALWNFGVLVKFKLALLIVFSAGVGYLVGAEQYSIRSLFLLCTGGFWVTAAANTLNQVFERDFDKKMTRTQNRPLVTGKIQVIEALLIAGLSGVLGLVLLSMFNVESALLGAISLLTYAFIYTPLKRISPIAVFVGAIPGALPPMIGCVAAQGTVSIDAWVLFGIQFLWQLPHFWAIAWVADDDYKAGGFRLLPSRGGKDKESALHCVLYGMLLIPAAVLPHHFQMVNTTSMWVCLLAGVFYMLPAVKLYQKLDRKSALQLMFASFIYLPVVQIALVVGKV
jgi:protoheme IX farnesyltransferase